jgi:hypothetical protein
MSPAPIVVVRPEADAVANTPAGSETEPEVAAREGT